MPIKIELYTIILGSFILVNQGDATFSFQQVNPSTKKDHYKVICSTD